MIGSLGWLKDMRELHVGEGLPWYIHVSNQSSCIY